MFGMPLTTEYDAKFRLLDIPVRINPFFWVMAALLGWQGRSGVHIVIWVACVFISILVHEFGHALTTRSLFHLRPSVVLYYMGGLCISDGEQRDLSKRALVLIMGPGAGFLLCGLVLLLGYGILGFAEFPFYGIHPLNNTPPQWFIHLPVWLNHGIREAYFDLVSINLIWGFFNLLPIFPLDGGQLAGVFLTMHDRREGARRGYLVGMVTAGLLAIYLFAKKEQFNAFFVATLAVMNFQLYQAAYYQRTSDFQYDNQDDWWRR
jgi:stage IV sporulation protein FB